MKKLISILTLASFSLVPTTNIIACENGHNSDDEIIGETIAQEIVDGAIDEINQTKKVSSTDAIGVKKEFEDFKDSVLNYKIFPEFIPMLNILILFKNFSENHSTDNDKHVFKLGLSLNVNPPWNHLLESNSHKFKVVPIKKGWFNDVKTITNSDKPKLYEFQLKFGRTLSKKTIKLDMFWEDK